MNSNSRDWARLQEIFEQALELPEQSRSEFLDQACRDDQGMREQVEGLLRSFGPAESELEPDGFGPTGDVETFPASAQVAVSGYDILDEIHRGGQGVVYRAIQQSTKREVALKFMLSGPLAGEASKRRFEREVELVGRLRHPGIVSVFDSGLAHGQYYYAMDLIDGDRLDRYVRDHRLGPAEVLELFARVCDAVNYAHQHGVIHRDLKPSNILVDRDGNPHVLDFGLAKHGGFDHLETISMTGQVMGTLAYMSPEQASAKPDAVDTRSDVYSLGVVLYELLTGELPYDLDHSFAENLSAIKNVEPNRGALRNSRIGSEVTTIVLKALSKDKERRYPIAGALGDDIRRYLRREPIEAKRDRALYVLRKALRRNMVPAAVAAAFLLMLVASSIVSFSLFLEAGHARDNMAELRNESLSQLYAAEMNLAGQALDESGGIARVKELTSHWAGTVDGSENRGWEWYYLRSHCDRESLKLEHGAGVWCVDWHPQLDRLAFGDEEGDVWIWDLESPPQKVGEIVPSARAVAWNLDGSLLAAAGPLDDVKVWDVASGELLCSCPHDDHVIALDWHPKDRHRLAFGSVDGTIEIWNVVEQRMQQRLDNGFSMQTIDWSSDGNRLCVASHDDSVRQWDVETKQLTLHFGDLGAPVFGARYSRDDKRIVICQTSGDVAVINAKTGRKVWSQHLERPVWNVCWGGDPYRVYTVGDDRTLRIWDRSHGNLISRLDGHENTIWALDSKPNGSMMATGSHDGTIRIWDANSRSPHTILSRLEGAGIHSLDWSPDGQAIAVGGLPYEVVVLHPDNRELAYQWHGHAAALQTVRWNQDGTQLASAGYDETVIVWDVSQSQPIHKFARHQGVESPDGSPNVVHAANWNGDERWIVSADQDGKLYVWDAESGEVRFELLDSRIVFDAKWHPTENAIAYVGSRSAAVKLWYPEQGQPPQTVLKSNREIRTLGWSPDGKLLAAGGGSGNVKIVRAETWEVVHTLRDHVSAVSCLAWSPDGTRLATGSADRTVRVWDITQGVQVLTLREHTASVQAVAWSRDGRKIASADDLGRVLIRDARLGFERAGR